ncbi:putative anthocyanidin 3-O-glucosyltransferase 2 [Iris pallida]|uniref:Glycosyltransferase n=1 Tax=Iris pallida TaxID=29817 RepID=A0AAX6ILS0_IRIPA|nr:putative anthocyanidin 3-O-glucosyltransferase 2 [Iris pallida]
MGQVKLVFLPLWLAGHQVSMLEFVKRLLHHTNNFGNINDISITVLLMKSPSSHALSLPSHPFTLPSSFSGLDVLYHDLPEVEPPRDTQGIEDFVSVFAQSHAPHVKAALAASSVPVTALVVDFFATTIIDIANELDIPTYVYFTSTAFMLGLFLHLPALDQKIDVDFEQVEEEIEIDGIASTVPSRSMPSALMSKSREGQRYFWLVYHGRRFWEAKGVIVNTFAELEHAVVAALGGEGGRLMHGQPLPQVYPVGPILSLGDADHAEGAVTERHECLKWLDGRPPASVVFLCFGSMGTFDTLQVREIASGLEQSGHRFLWSLHTTTPTDGGGGRSPTDTSLDDILPEGFLERTKERGMVWPSWVPQAQILSHGAVGGFVTHCGWNSCLESLWFGVPMLGWPLYAEQHVNELELVRNLGLAVGLRFDRRKDNFVTAGDLERGVRCLMGEGEEGKRVRERVGEMSLASRKAVEEGGSSYMNLKRLAADLICTKSPK